MEPQSFDCGEEEIERRLTTKNQASMEPQSFDCGERRLWTERAAASDRFNGAAVLRLRRVRFHLGDVSLVRASMEPQSFDCGEKGTLILKLAPYDNASMEPQSFDCGEKSFRFL